MVRPIPSGSRSTSDLYGTVKDGNVTTSPTGLASEGGRPFWWAPPYFLFRDVIRCLGHRSRRAAGAPYTYGTVSRPCNAGISRRRRAFPATPPLHAPRQRAFLSRWWDCPRLRPRRSSGLYR